MNTEKESTRSHDMGFWKPENRQFEISGVFDQPTIALREALRPAAYRKVLPLDKRNYETFVVYQWDMYKNVGESSPYSTKGDFQNVLSRKYGNEEGWKEPNAAKRSSFSGVVDLEGFFLPDSLNFPDGGRFDRTQFEIYTMCQVWCGEHKKGFEPDVQGGGVTTAKGRVDIRHVTRHVRPPKSQRLLWMISPLFAPDTFEKDGKTYPLERCKVTVECFAEATNISIWNFFYEDKALTDGAWIELTSIDENLVSEGGFFRVEVRVEGELQHNDPPAEFDRGRYFATLFMTGYGLEIVD